VAPDDTRPLTRVVEGLGSPDPGTRAAAGAAVDQFIRERLGLTWTEVADAIELVAALHTQKTAPHRPDTDWRFFFDDQCQMGFGRHFRGHIVATKELFGTGYPTKWTAALDGCVLRDAAGQVRLFPDMDEARRVIEALAMESKR
jgi:hypothetical protein